MKYFVEKLPKSCFDCECKLWNCSPNNVEVLYLCGHDCHEDIICGINHRDVHLYYEAAELGILFERPKFCPLEKLPKNIKN